MGRRKRSLAVALVIGGLACSQEPLRPSGWATASDGSGSRRGSQLPLGEIAAGIRASLASGGDPVFGEQTAGERSRLIALYQAGGETPLWIASTGQPSRHAGEAIALFRDARSEGLNPADYRYDHLATLANALMAASSLDSGDAVVFDVALSRAMLRYLHHVHLGRVDPRSVGFRLSVPAEGHDFVALLGAALAGDRIGAMVAELRPPLTQYNALRVMLARYRSLAAAGLELPPPVDTSVHPGAHYPGADVLHGLLQAFGDIPSAARTASDVYDWTLVEGVKRFQLRHGLEPDGVLGRGTQAALRVPLAWRVRQIELALERLRWLPDLGDRRLIAMNIPMFRFWAWDSAPSNNAPAFAMNVIVGRALSTQTPVFDEEMREVIFRPYWNVPRSILRNETLPLIERDPDYLGRQNMEIVRGDGDDAVPVAATPANLDLLRKGALRVRQRPGPNNALGLIKFNFPNEESVYMHGTPARALFSRSRRDFSHGCVRVEDPVTFAEWALKDRPEWTRDQIVSAMSGTRTLRVSLLRPIHVILFYTTAVVMPEDGTIHFADDIYRHDTRLDGALARPRALE